MLFAGRLGAPVSGRDLVLPRHGQRCRPLALEPRLLFDGAGLATAEASTAASAAYPVESGNWQDCAQQGCLSEACEPVSISVQKGAFADCTALDSALDSGHDAVGAADVSGVDAGDTVHYAISVRNGGTGEAFDLQVRDQLPSQIERSAVSHLRLLGADGVEVDYSGGDVLRNAASGDAIRTEAAFAEALFSDCTVEFVDPGGDRGYLGGSWDACRANQVTIAYQVTMPQTVVAGSDLHNEASVVRVATQECGENIVPACDRPSDGATVTIDSASLATRLTATNQVHTAGADAVIGEILTYETVITIPEGSSPDAVLTQWLDPGLSLVSVDSIVYADGVRSQAVPDPSAIVPDSFEGGEANRFVVDFGDISNHNRDNCVADTITVTYRAVTSNMLANQQGAERLTEAGYRSGQGPEADCRDERALVDLTAEAAPVTVVEPVLTVSVVPDGQPVEAGGLVEFVVTISNDSRVDAFDVTVDDLVLPAGLQLQPGSWAPMAAAGSLATVLRAGEQTSQRFVAAVARDAPVGQALPVDVQVRYTSLPDAAGYGEAYPAGTDNRNLSPFVMGSDTERTGADGAVGLNDYFTRDGGSAVPVASGPMEPPPVPEPSAPPPSAPPPPAPPLSTPPPVSGVTPGRLLPDDEWMPPGTGPLADAANPLTMLQPLAMLDPFARDPIPSASESGAFDLPLEIAIDPAVFGEKALVSEEPVGKDDDCIPIKPKAEKPKVVKRSVFADGAAQVDKKSFTEQVTAAKKRIAPPAVAKPRPAPDC